MDTAPIVTLFNQLMTALFGLGAIVCAFFLSLAGYQWMTAGGSVRAIESAKSSFSNALIGLAIVALSRVLANLVAAALGAPQAG
jgi:hypothetical protein